VNPTTGKKYPRHKIVPVKLLEFLINFVKARLKTKLFWNNISHALDNRN